MISIFTTITDPYRRQDKYIEAITNYSRVADEIVVVNGGREVCYPRDIKIKETESTWPWDFPFDLIGQQFQRGYDACDGDWAIKMDLDTFIHENDVDKLKEVLEHNKDKPAVCFVKMNWVKDDLFLPKARVIFAINKKKCGEHITWDASTTKSKPAYDGEELKEEKLHVAIPVYNYHFAFKEKEQIMEDRYRFANAWHQMTGDTSWGCESVEAAYDQFIRETKERYGTHKDNLVKIDHPKEVQKIIRELPGNRLYHWVDEIY
jgi:hypothetical protein